MSLLDDGRVGSALAVSRLGVGRYGLRVTTFALIGSGWRAQMFLKVARELGTFRCEGVVVRTPRRLDVPTFTSLDACLHQARPDFVLIATPRGVTPQVITDVVDRGLPVLAETPPAPDLEGLRTLWSAVGDSSLVQVAEQYLMMPSHAARAAVVAAGTIGTPTQVQISSTQQYHSVALIRGLLAAGRGPVTVRATRFTAPLMQPLSRTGWTDDEEAHPATTTIATLDFGDGRSGLYDFTDQQTRNQLRFRRFTVRGSAGELHNDEVVRMTGPRTLVRTPWYAADRVRPGPDRLRHRAHLPGSESCTATLIRVGAGWTTRLPWPLCWSARRAGCEVRARSPIRWPKALRTSRSRWPSRSRPIAIPR